MKTPDTFDHEAFSSALLTFCETDHPAIVLTQVDPDAVASAFALRHLCTSLHETNVPIFYSGSIAHPQNRSIINRYNLLSQMTPIDKMSTDTAWSVALVDSSKIDDPRAPVLSKSKPLMVIDHHRGTDIDDSEQGFLWIEEVGACSTLLSEIIFSMDAGAGQPAHLRALLALGIYTDTKALVSAEKRDREAYAWCTQDLPPSEVAQFIEYPLPESHFDNLKEALSHMSREKDKVVASCGVMAASDSDDLSTIADYLIRMTGVTLVVVWAIIGTKVRVSARNRDLTTPLDQFLKERLGSKSGAKLAPDGRGEGGAMLDLDLGPWFCDATKQHVLAMVKAKIEDDIFSVQR